MANAQSMRITVASSADISKSLTSNARVFSCEFRIEEALASSEKPNKLAPTLHSFQARGNVKEYSLPYAIESWGEGDSEMP